MPVVNFSLHGQVAVVTGAGRGIGRSIALALAEAGADVICVARTAAEVEKVAAEVQSFGRRASALSTDVSRRAQVEAMVEKTVATFGKIDILANGAGISPVYVRAENLTEEDWDRIIAVNLKGTFLCCQAVGRLMIEQKAGKIINMLSAGAHVALPRLLAYCASKGGGEMLTKVLAVEWAKHNVQVNAIAPAYVATDFTAGLRSNERIYENLMVRSPVGRMAQPEEIAGAAVFLASPSSSYVSGTTIVVDAGWTAW